MSNLCLVKKSKEDKIRESLKKRTKAFDVDLHALLKKHNVKSALFIGAVEEDLEVKKCSNPNHREPHKQTAVGELIQMVGDPMHLTKLIGAAIEGDPIIGAILSAGALFNKLGVSSFMGAKTEKKVFVNGKEQKHRH